jgi:hypothetical protein
MKHYHKPSKIVKKIVQAAGYDRNGADCYFCIISRDTVSVTTGVMRSFVYAVTCFSRYPILPVVSTVTFTCPTLPGSR